jgi:antitoxin (DNA-binding transcriptional repressor) of toxin-antitoxin stability system
MKTVSLEKSTLDACVKDAQHDRVVVTRRGKPVALVVGVEGMDEEQLALGGSSEFWQLIAKRRNQKPISRTELEDRLATRERK